jgi:hypothetical protein
VCGSCLWYTEAGQRLCPDHAADALKAGQAVTPPERYAGAIGPSEAAALRPAAPAQPYQGNSTDLTALIAALAGAAALLSCAGLSWVIPVVAFILGLVAWLHARDAADASRTRALAGLGLAGGGVFVALIAGFALILLLCFLLAFLSSVPVGPRLLPTPTP